MTVVARRVVLTGLACSALLALPADAQSRTLRIVYPFPAGGAGDAFVRALADRLQTSLGRPVIVENKTGAGGRIGAQAVKDAPADGSVLLFAAGAQFTLQPHVIANLGYDPFADSFRSRGSGSLIRSSPPVPSLASPRCAGWRGG